MFHSILILAQTANEGTTDAMNNALWQYPVAALLIAVVVMFLKDRKKSDEAHTKALEEADKRHERFSVEQNEIDREDRRIARQDFTGTLQAVQARSESSSRVQMETFRAMSDEHTKSSTAQLSRTIDALDRNTEAFGAVTAVLGTHDLTPKANERRRLEEANRKRREETEDDA